MKHCVLGSGIYVREKKLELVILNSNVKHM